MSWNSTSCARCGKRRPAAGTFCPRCGERAARRALGATGVIGIALFLLFAVAFVTAVVGSAIQSAILESLGGAVVVVLFWVGMALLVINFPSA